MNNEVHSLRLRAESNKIDGTLEKPKAITTTKGAMVAQQISDK